MYEFLKIAENLKSTVRFGSAPNKKLRESTADHSWKLALMVYVMAEQLDLKIDRLKAIKIALIHDIIEAKCGDVDYRDILSGKITKEEKNKREHEAMGDIAITIKGSLSEEIKSLWNEYEVASSTEALFVKALDKIETMTHLLRVGYKAYDIPDQIATYADKHVAKVPELKPLLKEIKKELKKEFKKGNFT